MHGSEFPLAWAGMHEKLIKVGEALLTGYSTDGGGSCLKSVAKYAIRHRGCRNEFASVAS